MQSLWMLVAAFLFSIMSLGVKLCTAYYSTSEIVAYRGGISLLLMAAIIAWQRGSLRTTMAGHHLWRGVVGVTALWMWFYAIGRLPLAMAVTLNYMSPIWIAVILFVGAWWRNHKRWDAGFILAIVMGFVGVILLLRPTMHADQLVGGLVALASGVLAALAYLQVRRMGQQGEPEYRVVFYFSLICMLAGIGGTIFDDVTATQPAPMWHTHDLKGFGLLVMVGVTAALAQMAMTRAYRLGNPLVTANLQYVGIVFSSLWDVLLWNERLAWLSWLGIAIILVSGMMASYYNIRNRTAKVETDPITSE
jgi:S-adenosylmethionine uptake transporter